MFTVIFFTSIPIEPEIGYNAFARTVSNNVFLLDSNNISCLPFLLMLNGRAYGSDRRYTIRLNDDHFYVKFDVQIASIQIIEQKG